LSTRIVVKGGSVLSGALSYLSAWQVPPTSPNLFFWIPLLQQAAVDGIQVMLDGEGGDELFGLSPYLLADLVRRGQILAAIALAQRFPGSVNPAAPSRIWRLLRRFGLKGAMPAAAHRAARRLRGPEHYAPSWMRPVTARTWIESEAGFDWKRLPGPRWWAHLVHSVLLGVGPALVYEQSRRRAEMAGLRARHPLVDVDVIELMLRIPPDLAFDQRFSRPLFRASLTGLLPDEVRLRPSKSNFDAIFHAALAGRDLPVVRQLLGRQDARLGEYVDLASVRRQLLDPGPPEGRSARQAWAIGIWRLLMAECWLQTLEDSAFPERMQAVAGEMAQSEMVTIDRPGLS
jgi:asparagine synthase (glutamine-hydrolysing)